MSQEINMDELLARYFSGEATPEEAVLVQQWRSESQENESLFRQSEKIWNLAGPQADSDKGWEKVQSSLKGAHSSRRVFLSAYWKIAAAIALLAGLVFTWRLMNTSEMLMVAHAAGQDTSRVKLEDGTKVALWPSSGIISEGTFGKDSRVLQLTGSAYFDVVHDDTKPFTIKTGHLFVQDIGTRFLITTSSDTDTVRVRVDEGIVLLFDESGTKIEIGAGGKAIYIQSSRKLIKEDPSRSSIPVLFRNAPLSEVVEQLRKVYKADIRLANSQLAGCKISTEFAGDDLETILSVITETLGLSWTRSGDVYLIQGDVCAR